MEPITEAITEQAKNGLCRRCNRKLKDPESIERGFGPICYEKHMSQIRVGKGLFAVPTHQKEQDNGNE